tara:strand:+ start:233 stop:1120 length:888 start_codon:yes stop_codon:yes gene_type:complete
LYKLKKNRPVLVRPIYGSITQGTVFSCARASRYEACDVNGLTITARCDVAQQKYPVLNYLPLVKLTDWLRRDGLDMLLEQERKAIGGKLKGMLKQAQLSESLPMAVSLEQIAETHFPLNEGKNKQQTANRKFHELVAEISSFEALSKNELDEKFSWFVVNRPKDIENIVRRLSKHDVLGHYFIEKISEDDEEATGYVCLLREVVTLPRKVAEKLGKGLDHGTYCSVCDGFETQSGLVIGHDDLAMPVIEIGSPTIEHILQSFSQLFGRIGVEDPVDNVIGGIIEHCVSLNKGLKG